MNRSHLSAQLERTARICLDSVVLIYHLEGIDEYADLTEEIIAHIASGRTDAVISVVTVTELLAKPYAEGRTDRIAEIEAFIHSFPNLQIAGLDEATAREAARLRGHYRLKTPDALIAATGLGATADTLITNDGKWERLKSEGVSVISLDSFRESPAEREERPPE